MKVERKAFHQRDAENTEIIHLFSLSRKAFGIEKNSHALRASSDRFKQLGQNVRSFPFLPSSPCGMVTPLNVKPFNWGAAYSSGISRKEKNVFLCDLRASSEAGGETYLAIPFQGWLWIEQNEAPRSPAYCIAGQGILAKANTRTKT